MPIFRGSISDPNVKEAIDELEQYHAPWNSGSRQLHVDERLDPFTTNNGISIKPGQPFEPGFYFRHLKRMPNRFYQYDIMDDLKKASSDRV
jgi:hypothetical protein